MSGNAFKNDRLLYSQGSGTMRLSRLSPLYLLMPKKNNNDQRWSQLMQKAQQGDEVAYASLLTELSQVIAKTLHYQFGSFSFIDDCVQESLIAIHEARNTYQPNRPFRPWMNALVRYKTIDLIRKQNRYQEVSGIDPDSTSLENCLRQSTAALDDRLAGAALLAALEKPNRDALIYTKFVGLSIEESAIKLNITPAAVKQRVKRAIAKTNRLLAESLA